MQLLRQPIGETEADTLVTINLKDASDPFRVTGMLQVARASPAALEEYRLVDNSAYKYLIMAKLIGGDNTAAEIHGLQVSFRRT